MSLTRLQKEGKSRVSFLWTLPAEGVHYSAARFGLLCLSGPSGEKVAVSVILPPLLGLLL